MVVQVLPPGDDDGCGGGGGGGGSGGCHNEYEEVGPLLQTTWDQWEGYNNMAPYYNCSNTSNGRALTGCIATAMAQVMRYHQFPYLYNWGIMPNAVNYANLNSAGTNEIARLMRDIGNDVGMNYGCDGSGIIHTDAEYEIPQTFKSDFGYATATYRDYEETAQYENVKTELRAGRPVIFKGGRRGGTWPVYWYEKGHAWVGDGFRRIYSWNEDCSMAWGYLYFHMNWGWGGNHDEWYGFMDFTPGSHTYNYKSGVVLNIKP